MMGMFIFQGPRGVFPDAPPPIHTTYTPMNMPIVELITLIFVLDDVFLLDQSQGFSTDPK
jgi:hypothetical protein